MRKLLMSAIVVALAACGGQAETNSGEVNSAPVVSSRLPDLTGDYVWTVDNSKSTLQFKGTEKGNTFLGTFGGFDTVIRLNPSDLSNAEIHARISLSPMDAGNSDRNSELPGGAWFDVKKFPAARYSSTDIEKLDGENYRANGTLTIKERSNPVELTFSLIVDGRTAIADGGATINRIDFDLGNDKYWTEDEKIAIPVDILFHIEAKR